MDTASAAQCKKQIEEDEKRIRFSSFTLEDALAIGQDLLRRSPAPLAVAVRIADRVLFGTGIHIEPWVTIGCNCIIASGVTLTQHVPDGHSARTTTLPIIGAVGPGFAEADKDRE